MYDEIEDVWCAWTAGIIDGEGSMSAAARKETRKNATDRTKNKRRVNTFICVRMTDNNAINKLYELWNGSLFERTDKRNNGIRRLIYGWRLYNKDTISFLEKILPYLITKRKQANLLIELRKRIEGGIGIETVYTNGRPSRWITDRELNQRMKIRDLIRECNIRGGRFPYQSYIDKDYRGELNTSPKTKTK